MIRTAISPRFAIRTFWKLAWGLTPAAALLTVWARALLLLSLLLAAKLCSTLPRNALRVA
jgi:hypothetical protein